MPSKKSKVKVSQADLRKMMQQMKSKKTEVNPINGKQGLSDNALKRKYSDHIHATTSKIHKPNISNDKNSLSTVNIKSVQSKNILFKKPEDSTIKKRHFEDQTENLVTVSEQPTKKLKKIMNVKTNKSSSKSMPLVATVYSDSSNSSDDDAPSSSISNKSEPAKSEKPLESSLPAGFFDDPEVDAKIRGVETPADKMDREWESFQRELQRETGQSEQIIVEEQETGHIDREIDEIDEQIQFYTLIDKLCDKKDSVSKKKDDPPIKKEEAMEVDSSSDENEDILDWREKDAFT